MYTFPDASSYGSPILSGYVAAIPLARNAATFIFCQEARSDRIINATFVSNIIKISFVSVLDDVCLCITSGNGCEQFPQECGLFGRQLTEKVLVHLVHLVIKRYV